MAALGRVAAGVAHEIRNPIAAMRLRAENGLAGDDARRRKALEEVLHLVTRLDNLVTELLAITQRREARPQQVNVPAFLAAQVGLHAEAAAARGITVTSDCAVAEAWFDPALTARIVGNLLSNAVRHTPNGGRVSVTVSRTGGRLRLTVTDTGPGIAPELHERLFEPFVTGHPAGTGLGLAIARELSNAHGGCLHLNDPGGQTPGCGAVFVLELPNEPVCRPS